MLTWPCLDLSEIYSREQHENFMDRIFGEGYHTYHDLDYHTFIVNTSSVWAYDNEKPKPLDAPSLNITWLDNVRPTNGGPLGAELWTPDGRTGNFYNQSYILSHGSCKPSETYQWGFSYIFLFMVSIFNFVWTCIMVGMWFDTTRASRMYKSGKRPGLLRSVLDISAVIREELGARAEHLQEDDLRKALRDSSGALVVPKTELRIGRTKRGDEDVRKRGWRRNLTSGSTF